MNLYENIKNNLKEDENVQSGMTLYDYIKNVCDGEIDMDVCDNDIDMMVAFCHNINEHSSEYPQMERFLNLLAKRTKIIKQTNGAYSPILICDFSSALKPYNEEWKKFFDMDYSEFDEDEAYYEAVVNLEPLISGNAGENTYKEFCDIMEGKKLEESEEENKEQICVICNKPFTGWGNDAWPVAEGYCCDECNFSKVIPARLAQLREYRNDTKIKESESFKLNKDADDFEDLVKRDFQNYIEDTYNIQNAQELADRLEHVTEEDINDYFTTLFYEIFDNEDMETANLAEEIIRKEYGLQDNINESAKGQWTSGFKKLDGYTEEEAYKLLVKAANIELNNFAKNNHDNEELQREFEDKYNEPFGIQIGGDIAGNFGYNPKYLEFLNSKGNLDEAEDNQLYVFSNAESEDMTDAISMINSKYKDEAPKLQFKMHSEGPMWFVDFIGSYQDICDYLIKLGWYNEKEINDLTNNKLIRPLPIKESEEKINPNNLTKDQLWKLRQEIRLNSIYTNDYENSFNLDPVAVQDFFDTFIEDMEQDDDGNPNNRKIEEYDNAEDLYNFYTSCENPFGEIENINESEKQDEEIVWKYLDLPYQDFKANNTIGLLMDKTPFIVCDDNLVYLFDEPMSLADLKYKTYQIDDDYEGGYINKYFEEHCKLLDNNDSRVIPILVEIGRMPKNALDESEYYEDDDDYLEDHNDDPIECVIEYEEDGRPYFMYNNEKEYIDEYMKDGAGGAIKSLTAFSALRIVPSSNGDTVTVEYLHESNLNEGNLPNISEFIYNLDVDKGNAWSAQSYTKNSKGDKIIIVSRNGQSENTAEDIVKAVEEKYPKLKGEPTVNGRSIWFYLKESSLNKMNEAEEVNDYHTYEHEDEIKELAKDIANQVDRNYMKEKNISVYDVVSKIRNDENLLKYIKPIFLEKMGDKISNRDFAIDVAQTILYMYSIALPKDSNGMKYLLGDTNDLIKLNLTEAEETKEEKQATKIPEPIMVYMNTWKNYNEYGADLDAYGIKDGWMTIDNALEFCKKYANDEPFINDIDNNTNINLEVSEYDNAPSVLEGLKELNDALYFGVNGLDLDEVALVYEAWSDKESVSTPSLEKIDEFIDYLNNGEYYVHDDITSTYDIGKYYVDNVGYEGVSNIENYIDSDQVKEDWQEDIDQNYLDDDGNPTEDWFEYDDSMIEEIINSYKEANDENFFDKYFDYESLGDEIYNDGYWYVTDNGSVEIY